MPEGQTEAAFLESEARVGLEAALANKFEVESVPAKERAAYAAPYFERLQTELALSSRWVSGLFPDRCRLYPLGSRE